MVWLNLQDFEEVGREAARTMLDMLDINPCSRLLGTPFRNLRNLRLYIARLLVGEVPYKSNLYLRCLLGAPVDCYSENNFKMFVKYVEQGHIESDVFSKRRIKFSRKTLPKMPIGGRRLFKPKLKRRLRKENAEGAKPGPRRLRNQGRAHTQVQVLPSPVILPPLRKNLSSPKKRFRSRGPRISRSKARGEKKSKSRELVRRPLGRRGLF